MSNIILHLEKQGHHSPARLRISLEVSQQQAPRSLVCGRRERIGPEEVFPKCLSVYPSEIWFRAFEPRFDKHLHTFDHVLPQTPPLPRLPLVISWWNFHLDFTEILNIPVIWIKVWALEDLPLSHLGNVVIVWGGSFSDVISRMESV